MSGSHSKTTGDEPSPRLDDHVFVSQGGEPTQTSKV
jgi:hypothetical protein